MFVRHLAVRAVLILSLMAFSGLLLAQQDEREEEDRSQPDRISEPLNEVLAGQRKVDAVALRISWKEKGVPVTAEFYGTGIGIWNNQSQFPLPRPALMALLQAVRDAGFGAMPSQFGTEPEDLVELRGRVTLTIEDVSQAVEQLTTGEQSDPLADLVKKGLTEARTRGAKGISVTGLDEGLEALASKRLAPEVLRLSIAVRRDAGSADRGPEGWLLKIEGRRAEALLYRREGGYEPGRHAELSSKEFRGLVASLARSGVSHFPGNLYADDYTDLQLSVLGQARDVAARRTARSGPPANPRQEEAMGRLREELLELAQAVLRRGAVKPSGPGDAEGGRPEKD